MEGTDLAYILLLTVIPVALTLLIALPFIAGRPSARNQPGRQSARRAAREDVGASAPGQRGLSSRLLERTPPGPAGRAA